MGGHSTALNLSRTSRSSSNGSVDSSMLAGGSTLVETQTTSHDEPDSEERKSRRSLTEFKSEHRSRSKSVLSVLPSFLSNLRGSTVPKGESSTTNVLKKIFSNPDPELVPAKPKNKVIHGESWTLLKVSSKSKKRIQFKVDIETMTFTWNTAHSSEDSSFQKLHLHSKLYKFSVDDIRRLLFQLEARHYRDELNISKELEKQWITITYFDHNKNKLKTVHLVADTENDARNIYTAIDFLYQRRMEYSLDDAPVQIARPQRQFLFFEDIVRHVERLHINVSRTRLRNTFDSLTNHHYVDGAPALDFEGFKGFVAELKRRTDINNIWLHICPSSTMRYSEFKKFLIDGQKESFDEENMLKIFNKFSKLDLWDSESLNKFLLSKYSRAIDIPLEDKDYYSRPLNEYFVSSSHNTYLMGRQVADISSSEGYVRALQKGCRCVEIDIWDGEEDADGPNPIVCHGRAFTLSIGLRPVLNTIKRHAFVSSQFPLIISLEINCSSRCQSRVAALLNECLGDTMVQEPLNKIAILPSPNDLKNRILIKVKKTNNSSSTTSSLSLSSISTSTSTSSNSNFSEDSASSLTSSVSRKRRKASAIILELSIFGVYVQGIKFRNFSLPESKTYNHCFSLNEKLLDSMLKDEVQRRSVNKHNRRYWMRVYPHKFRLTSSNFNPLRYWQHGVQMVATNWQTYDIGQQLNEALFDGPNKTGYYLKPTAIRRPLQKYTLRETNEVEEEEEEKRIHFLFTIVSAHQLPRLDSGTTNPYVSFEVFGAKDVKYYKSSLVESTSIVEDNGFNPVWNETFEGEITSNSDLIFVKFSLNNLVKKDQGEPVGVFILRLQNLKLGYRYLQINDAFGEELIYSSLFVKINYETL